MDFHCWFVSVISITVICMKQCVHSTSLDPYSLGYDHLRRPEETAFGSDLLSPSRPRLPAVLPPSLPLKSLTELLHPTYSLEQRIPYREKDPLLDKLFPRGESKIRCHRRSRKRERKYYEDDDGYDYDSNSNYHDDFDGDRSRDRTKSRRRESRRNAVDNTRHHRSRDTKKRRRMMVSDYDDDNDESEDRYDDVSNHGKRYSKKSLQRAPRSEDEDIEDEVEDEYKKSQRKLRRKKKTHRHDTQEDDYSEEYEQNSSENSDLYKHTMKRADDNGRDGSTKQKKSSKFPSDEEGGQNSGARVSKKTRLKKSPKKSDDNGTGRRDDVTEGIGVDKKSKSSAASNMESDEYDVSENNKRKIH